MANKLEIPSQLKMSWYQQYQETDVTIALGIKTFAVTSRLSTISPQHVVGQGVKISFISDDIGGIDKNNLWVTMGADSSSAPKKRFTFSVTGIFNAGEQRSFDINDGTINTDDIIGVAATSGLQSDGPYNWGYSAYVTQAGQIRLLVTNTSQNTANPSFTVTVRTFISVNQLGTNIYNFGFRKGSPLWGEWAENGIPINKVEEALQVTYNLMKANDPSILLPRDTNLYGDYYDGLNGSSLSQSLERQGVSNSAARARLASQSAARKNSIFFTGGQYLHRNAIVGGYQDGLNSEFNGKGVYNHILNHEIIFAAENTLGVGTFGWGLIQGINSVEENGIYYSLPLPGVQVYRLSFAITSHSMILAQSFFSLLMGSNYTMWESGVKYGTTPTCWDRAHLGGTQTGVGFKTKVKLDGGIEEDWNPDNPLHPKENINCGSNARWPDLPRITDNAGFIGAWLYDQIKNKANTKLKYPTYSYVDDSGSHTGYFNGNAPRAGSKGDGSLNCRNNSNYGQETIIDNWDYKKPILIEGLGSSGDCLVYINLFAGENETQTLTVTTTNYGIQTLTHVGSSLAVWSLN